VVARYDENLTAFDVPAQFYLGSRRLGYYGSSFTNFLHPTVLGSTMMVANQAASVVADTSSFPENAGILYRAGWRVLPIEAWELQKVEAGVTCMSLIFTASERV
jgi:hypothetical protein